VNASPPEDRRSALAPDSGGRLAFADLHNHSLMSDGDGDPERAFVQMRSAGLDVAALTDHASIPDVDLPALGLEHYPDRRALAMARMAPRSIDLMAWKRTGEIADAHDVPGEFTALRGFEWTEPWLGHVNVWFSAEFLPVTTPGSVSGLHTWLTDQEPDALFGYNHPGREPGRLSDFERPADDALADRLVALEVFNRANDFLFAGHRHGWGSPVAACLDAGWRPALIGSSDEHGRAYGLAGKGRTGLWVDELSRPGVRRALEARRAYATREVALRLDATMDGVRMGGALAARPGRHELAVDLAGSACHGIAVELQLLTGDGTGQVELVGVHGGRVGEVARLDVDLPPGTPWLALRVADPGRGSDTPGPAGHAANAWGLAYASPWWFDGSDVATR
jgi:hypothetical protein